MPVEPPLVSPVPTRGPSDATHAVAKGMFGMVPVVGHLLAELFTQVVAPSLERRREAWLRQVADALDELHKRKGIEIEKLRDDEKFVSLILNATQIALRNHNQIKLDSLRNAVVSGHELLTAEGDEIHLFVRMIDELSPSQLSFVCNFLEFRVSDFYGDGQLLPHTPRQTNDGVRVGNSTSYWLEAPLEAELFSRGLYRKTNKFHPNDPGDGVNKLTVFGYRFRKFIKGGESEADRYWFKETVFNSTFTRTRDDS